MKKQNLTDKKEICNFCYQFGYDMPHNYPKTSKRHTSHERSKKHQYKRERHKKKDTLYSRPTTKKYSRKSKRSNQ